MESGEDKPMVLAKEDKPTVLEIHNKRLWNRSSDYKGYCIYRVPNAMRKINPEAYTPQMVLIGPLHHSMKAEAAELVKQKWISQDFEETKSRYLDYLNMEQQKHVYLESFLRRLESGTMADLRSIIQEKEAKIRSCYAESTTWIKSPEFVDMIILDAIFLIEFFLTTYNLIVPGETADFLVDRPLLRYAIYNDLILLENQLPYFIVEELYNLVPMNLTFRKLVLSIFDLSEAIPDDMTFMHFTDLHRCVRVNTLNPTARNSRKPSISHLYNAEKLHSSGVAFKVVSDENSIDVRFNNKCLHIPVLGVYGELEMILRNMMALEQCHYPYETYICNYMVLLDFLIDTEKDVDLLEAKGIIQNWVGHQASISEMVNTLCLGIVETHSCYFDIAEQLNRHHGSFKHRTMAMLRRVYFNNLWKGTATVAGIALLLMTFIQTAASILQVLQK